MIKEKFDEYEDVEEQEDNEYENLLNIIECQQTLVNNIIKQLIDIFKPIIIINVVILLIIIANLLVFLCK